MFNNISLGKVQDMRQASRSCVCEPGRLPYTAKSEFSLLLR